MMNLHIGMFIQIVIYPYYIVFITINHIKDSTNKEDYYKIEWYNKVKCYTTKKAIRSIITPNIAVPMFPVTIDKQQ